MKLTDKALLRFKDWYREFINWNYYTPHFEGFYTLPEQMKWGMVQEWADSIDYDLSVIKMNVNEYSADISILSTSSGHPFNILWEAEYKTRLEAQAAAIEKLNEILNKA